MRASRSGYVHGYGEREGARLREQAAALETLLHAGTSYPQGARVLELGCGVGAQTVPLARRSPAARFLAVDRSATSIAAAVERVRAAGLRNVEFLHADIFMLPLRPASFDHIFVCFVLEHLAEPMRALRILKQLLRPRGTITVIEGDHGTTCFHPESKAGDTAVAALVTQQQAMGGDANIGRKLYPLLTQAGFDAVRIRPRMVYADGSRPELAEAFVRLTFAPMVEGIRDAAVADGLVDLATFDDGLAALRRAAEPDGVFCYTFFKAVARTSPV